MLREDREVTKIETHPAGQIGVYSIEKIYKDDEILLTRDLFKIYNPGDTIDDSEDERVKKIANATWTQELIDQFKEDSQTTLKNFNPEE